MGTGGHEPGRGLSRRRFLGGLGGAGIATGAGLWDPVRAAASVRAAMATVVDATGTTLELSIQRPSGAGYVKLVEGPAYALVVREELAAAQPGREGRRTSLASIVHLTDVHVVDAQSPARVEFTDRLPGPFASAFRAQESLCTQVAAAMVERVNAVARGPVTGRPFDVAVSTGDNIDNQQHNELEWFLALLDGGSLTPNSGAPDRYEGVQDADVGIGYYRNYWHPDAPPGANPPDGYKADHGFPELPGLLDAAIAEFASPGLDVPWYSTYGNHDGLVQGNVPGELPGGVLPFDAILTGPVKVTAVGTSLQPADLYDAVQSLPSLVADPAGAGAVARVVTPDVARRAVTLEAWIRAHLDSPAAPGPVGHGYAEDMIESRRLYYTFPISEQVLGISLDTVNHGGYADGSLGDAHLAWLEQQLAGAGEQLVVLSSHHNLYTLENPLPDLFDPADPRRGFAVLRELLSRFPNVIAWVNGHSHVNRVTPVPDPSGRTGGFWEISTAAHIDWPEQARLIEVVDNRDGTLSIFGTLVEHAGPATVDIPDPSSATPMQLASLSRELAANDPQVDPGALGEPIDRNVELLVASPFARPVPPPAGPPPPAPPVAAPAPGELPATGGPATGALGVALGAAGAAALALRRRAEGSTEPVGDQPGS
ncbi:MAG TPA: TIGR03767 family metallophosphoesterase [Acidimicrobiales bacterium]|nr:TIGR03767 family metallophosphoesterase [Acidimicrobiales bacterium]